MMKLRFAKPEDMQGVLALIQELATYENAANEVTVTVEDLQKDGFTDNLFTCIIAENAAREIVGIALYYPRYSTWKGRTIHLEDFVVKESCRKNGVGRMLFDAVVHEAKKFGAKRMEWAVLNWNEPALNFYNKIGAEIDKEWYLAQLREADISAYKFNQPVTVAP